MKRERGSSFLETVVALALLGVFSTSFLSALATTSTTRLIADEHASARILAESQMETLRKEPYASSYSPVAVPDQYRGYTAVVEVDTLRNGSIQKITVAIWHHGKEITTLESYKTNR